MNVYKLLGGMCGERNCFRLSYRKECDQTYHNKYTVTYNMPLSTEPWYIWRECPFLFQTRLVGVWRNIGEGVGVYIAQNVLEEIRSIFLLHICICKIKKVVVFKNVVREYFVQNFFKEYAYFSLRMMSFFQKSVVEVVGGRCCNMYMYVPTEIAIYMPNVFFNF